MPIGATSVARPRDKTMLAGGSRSRQSRREPVTARRWTPRHQNIGPSGPYKSTQARRSFGQQVGVSTGRAFLHPACAPAVSAVPSFARFLLLGALGTSVRDVGGATPIAGNTLSGVPRRPEAIPNRPPICGWQFSRFPRPPFVLVLSEAVLVLVIEGLARQQIALHPPHLRVSASPASNSQRPASALPAPARH